MELKTANENVSSGDEGYESDGAPQPGINAVSSTLSKDQITMLKDQHRESGFMEFRPFSFNAKAGAVEHLPVKHIPLPQKAEATCTSFSCDSMFLAVGCRQGNILFINRNKGEIMQDIKLDQQGDHIVCTCVRFRPNVSSSSLESILIAAQGNKVVHIHPGTSKVLSTIDEGDNKVNNIAIRGDGLAYATAGSDHVVRVYDEAVGKLTGELRHGDGVNTAGQSNIIFGLTWSDAYPYMILSGGWDHSVQIWDTRVQRSIGSIWGPYICGDSLDMRGDKVLTGSWREAETIQVWDLASRNLLKNLPMSRSDPESASGGRVYAARLVHTRQETMVVAGGAEKLPHILIYKEDGSCAGKFVAASPVQSIDRASLPNGQQAVAVCCVNSLHLVDL